MLNPLPESDRAADPLRGRIGNNQLWRLRLHRLQLLHHRIKVFVGDLRLILDIILMFVIPKFFSELIYLIFDRLRGHILRKFKIYKYSVNGVCGFFHILHQMTRTDQQIMKYSRAIPPSCRGRPLCRPLILANNTLVPIRWHTLFVETEFFPQNSVSSRRPS